MFITSANAVFTLSARPLYPSPQVLQGWATDDAWANDSLVLSESIMGVDGIMSSGFTPNINVVNLAFQADSPSFSIMEYIAAHMKQTKECILLQATLLIPSIKKSYVLTDGVLTSLIIAPAGKKILAPQSAVLTFANISSAVV